MLYLPKRTTCPSVLLSRVYYLDVLLTRVYYLPYLGTQVIDLANDVSPHRCDCREEVGFISLEVGVNANWPDLGIPTDTSWDPIFKLDPTL